MWTEQLASAAPSPGALAAARALIDAIRVVASECVRAWVDAPPDAADVAVEEVVRSNPALGFAHVLLPPVESRAAVRRVVGKPRCATGERLQPSDQMMKA